ncbi:MAG: hypothetical protein IKU82_00300 [Clostridia bacterium]|nr:hypothetical protein [Clostridia bacterium]
MSNVMRRLIAILGILVGLIIIIIGFSTADTYISTADISSGLVFGADFYTEIYDVTSDVGRAVNYNTYGLSQVCEAIGMLIVSIGAIDVLAFTYLLFSPKQKTYKKVFCANQNDVKISQEQTNKNVSENVETTNL